MPVCLQCSALRVLGLVRGDGAPFCIYPWFSWDGEAINYGVHYPDTASDLGGVGQFAQTATCPEDGVFAGPTYCATIIK